MSAAPPTGMLDGIYVLDLASVGPAARASRWLADYGASVTKVGPVPRDGGVQITPPAYAYSASRGMDRALFDLKSEAGRDAFLTLAATADVVIESFRPGVVDRLGIGYDDLRSHNPGIILCSTSGYGQDGPRSGWAGHDLNYLAAGGYLHCSGRGADGGPSLPGATVADSAAGGLHAVASICAALVGRAQNGEGTHLDVAIADGTLSLMSLYIDEYFATGTEPGPGHNLLTGRNAWYDVYEAGDGKWLAVGAIEPRFYANLCEALGCERWIEYQNDDAAQQQIRDDFTAAFRTKSRDEWVEQLGPGDTCVSAVQTVPELVEDEQFVARGAFADVEHPTEGAMRQVSAVLAGQGSVDEMTIVDQSETNTFVRLSAAGMNDADIESLIDQGAVA